MIFLADFVSFIRLIVGNIGRRMVEWAEKKDRKLYEEIRRLNAKNDRH